MWKRALITAGESGLTVDRGTNCSLSEATIANRNLQINIILEYYTNTVTCLLQIIFRVTRGGFILIHTTVAFFCSTWTEATVWSLWSRNKWWIHLFFFPPPFLPSFVLHFFAFEKQKPLFTLEHCFWPLRLAAFILPCVPFPRWMEWVTCCKRSMG